jgi:hypothetical protein
MRPETDTMYPYFEISPENVEFLNEPGEFYSELKVSDAFLAEIQLTIADSKCSSSNKRKCFQAPKNE